eukprot:m.31931 g.31931  ORF g.31931 m.31931 type:complete len:264 (-) comp9352_c1_seq1:229-1020(-)
MASTAAFFQMDGFGEDYDVLPIPTTAFDSYMPQLNFVGRLFADPAATNVHDLENLLSPVESEPMHHPTLEEEPMSASDNEEEEEEETLDFGARFNISGQSDEMFPVDPFEERHLGMSPDTPSRPRQRTYSESKRYSPFPSSAAAAPSPMRAKLKLVAPKLSASLPAPAIAMPVPSQVADNKRCACCGCSNTPMWRDGRDGQRLCNACGIRWQKYGVCCPNCHYVPRKLENNSGECRRCQAALPPPVPTRRRSTSVSSAGKPGS